MWPLSSFLSLCCQATVFAASDLVFCCVVLTLPPLLWASSRSALAWYVGFFLVSWSPGGMELIWLFACWVKSWLSYTCCIILFWLQEACNDCSSMDSHMKMEKKPLCVLQSPSSIALAACRRQGYIPLHPGKKVQMTPPFEVGLPQKPRPAEKQTSIRF